MNASAPALGDTVGAGVRASTVLRFDDLERYLLLRNGNDLYRVPFEGGWAVLKVYFGSRSGAAYALKTAGNWLVAGQTSVMPRARRRQELACLRVWREAGVRVFGTYNQVSVEGLPEGGYTLFEYVEAMRFVEYFGDLSIPLAERLATWRRFLPVWHRRHRIAVDEREPRLVHENGDLKHVMMLGDEFLFFDFETCFRSRRRVSLNVAREILCFLKSMGRTVPEAEFEAFLRETIEHYPCRSLLRETARFAFGDPNPLIRMARALDRRLRARARKRTSKYAVAARLQELLSAS